MRGTRTGNCQFARGGGLRWSIVSRIVVCLCRRRDVVAVQTAANTHQDGVMTYLGTGTKRDYVRVCCARPTRDQFARLIGHCSGRKKANKKARRQHNDADGTPARLRKVSALNLIVFAVFCSGYLCLIYRS